jgi:uncharacterized protein YdhG (YjbR/CyaY superfamily)
MESNKTVFKSIDDYIRIFPKGVGEILEGLRRAVKAAAPDAEERISYRMPAFWLRGNLVYFAAYRKHIGFYPTSSAVRAFKKELSVYKGAKGSVQFPINEPLPLQLIGRIVKFRVSENTRRWEDQIQGEKSGAKAAGKKRGNPK